jgi:hypothetical protein
MIPARFEVKVVGVSFHDDYPENLHRLRETAVMGGGEVEGSLIREPDNPHDPNAVAVLIAGQIVGHVPAFLAEKLGPDIDAGVRYTVDTACVLVNPEHEDRPGLLITCVRVPTEVPA